MVEQGPRHRGPPEGLRWEAYTQRSTVHNSDGQDTCVPHAKWMPALETVLWIDENWCILLQSSTQPIKRHTEGFSEVLRHQSWLLGGKCAKPLQLAHPRPLWNVNLWFEAQSCWGMQEHEQEKSKASTISLLGRSPELLCPHCNWRFKVRIGLISHLHTHIPSHLIPEVVAAFTREGRTTADSSCIRSTRIFFLPDFAVWNAISFSWNLDSNSPHAPMFMFLKISS